MKEFKIDIAKAIQSCDDAQELVLIYYQYLINSGLYVHESVAVDEMIFGFKQLIEKNRTSNNKQVSVPVIDLYTMYRELFFMSLKHRDNLQESEWSDDYGEKYLKFNIEE